MRRLFMLTAMLAICCTAAGQETTKESRTRAVTADEVIPKETSEKPLDFWMQKKLDYSTDILRGLSMGDFDLIESNARQMRLLNKIEGFVRGRNAEYRTQVHTFERVTDEVVRQAKKKNIDGVTLAYHQLTFSCVRCHQSLRESK
ncbi:hypothetical protein [Rhodopirellula bahusiensis]|uniref:hypothetical protein n=1 Tax=Rhodopirellula bahusiensis TaxID=2014065 RepID=UPI003263C918